MNTLALLNTASAEKLDPSTRRVRMSNQIVSIIRQLPIAPDLSPRLRAALHEPERLKWMDAEDLVDALSQAISADDKVLRDELLALTLTVACLGSNLMAMRLGKLIIDEMCAKPAEG